MKRAHPSSAFIHACMNSHGAVRSKRYHAVSVFKYASGIIVSVSRSPIGYFKSVTVDAPCRRPTDRELLSFIVPLPWLISRRLCRLRPRLSA
jgi:hypothetical protein